MNGEIELPQTAIDTCVNDNKIANLRRIAESISEELASGQVTRTAMCYRPMSTDGEPLIGKIDGLENAFVATGHTFWGITLAPGIVEIQPT